ncbi:MAG: putative hydrolase [Clostridia bacterium]|jgi:HAD superfamily hydrolase (TIGR01509 family)|nr:putative hydrolase [Clostridia bacterium]
MIFKGAIFDLDGTLIDSMAVWKHIGAEFLLSHGITPPEDIEAILKPMSFYQSAQYFMEEHQINYTPEEIMEMVYKQVADKYRETIPLKEAVKEYLTKLRQKEIKMCVATASNKELAAYALKRLGVLHLFDFIITCDELGTGKDEPHIYSEAARLLGIDKRDICVFEDALYCVRTAKSAGFKVVGVYDEAYKMDREELIRRCDHFIMSFKELL